MFEGYKKKKKFKRTKLKNINITSSTLSLFETINGRFLFYFFLDGGGKSKYFLTVFLCTYLINVVQSSPGKLLPIYLSRLEVVLVAVYLSPSIRLLQVNLFSPKTFALLFGH